MSPRAANLGHLVAPPLRAAWIPPPPPPDIDLLRRVIAGLERLTTQRPRRV